MRKILVSNFQFHYRFKLFGKTFKVLRAANVLFPHFVLTGLIVTGDPMTWDLFWYDYLALFLLYVSCSFGFPFLPPFYWKKNPPRMEELDVEQEFDYLTMIDLMIVKNPETDQFSRLTIAQWHLFNDLRYLLDAKYNNMGKFANLSVLLPPLLSICAIIGWYIYWQ